MVMLPLNSSLNYATPENAIADLENEYADPVTPRLTRGR